MSLTATPLLESNKALVRKAYLDGMNKRDLSIIDEVFSPDYVVHYPGMEPIQGRDKAKKSIASFLNAFPDIVFRVEDQVAEQDKVVLRWSASGTFSGLFTGFPKEGMVVEPDGRNVSFGATDIYRICDNLIVEEWNTMETMELMRQLGLVDLPPQD